MMATRDTILAKLRAATGEGTADYDALPKTYIRTGSRHEAEQIALLIERLRDYDAETDETAAAQLPETIAAVLARSGRKRFAVPPGLPANWLAPGFDWRRDEDLSHAALDACDGVITGASFAIADSGTIALHHGPTEGRRVLSLLPDWHLIVLFAGQIVETLPDYFAAIATPPPRITWISGPSATADIEMTRIKGVHGPRFLNVIVVRDTAS